MKRYGMKLIKSFDEDEIIVAMTQHQETIFIATNKRVFKQMLDGKFEQLEFSVTDE